MEFELKPLTREGIPGALEKARHYRMLNEPGNAESICRDVLAVDPEHVAGRIELLLALTDQFRRGLGERYDEALALARSLPDPYEQAYYIGIVFERRAKAHHQSHAPGSGAIAHDWFLKAMAAFETAERQRPKGDDKAILRWNSCVRRLRVHAELRPAAEETGPPPITGD